MNKRMLAFDFGASSGRAMLGEFDGSTITLTEVHRFENDPVMLRGTYYWDVLDLFGEIKQGILRASHLGPIDCIGIDTWGVDFGLLDENGDLLQNPVHYRDKRTAGLPAQVEALLGENKLYETTGIQVIELNTSFQLYALAQNNPALLQRAQCALLMPDLFGYFLTGERTAEYTMASTTQLMDAHSHQWNEELMEALGIPPRLFPGIAASGKPLGTLSPDIQEELSVGPIPVVSVAGHDTGSAVAAVPAQEKDFLYISCGTWSLFGTELDAPIITEQSRRLNISNEGGYGYTTRFLKNICGLWLIQETRRQYKREGTQYSYGDLGQLALDAAPFACFIDPDDPRFATPGNLPRRIREYCRETGQSIPETVGAVLRCIYESLAMKYRYTCGQIKACTQKQYAHIHMVGGGIQDKLLCQMTANATGCRVMAGPVEATALGNIAVQLISARALTNLTQARQVIGCSYPPELYAPADTGAWDSACQTFLKSTRL